MSEHHQGQPEGLTAEVRSRFAANLVLPDSTRSVLETYSNIPSEQVDSHVYYVRDKAWAVHPYPCIGEGRFLDLAIGQHTLYKSEILPRMLTGEQTYLDLGCAFAQDIRRLVADGVESSKCYGSDLRLDFIELGYGLFRDKETLKSKFIDADIFDPKSPLVELEGKIDVIGASSFFHLFNWDEQKQIARSVTRLLKPQKDSLVVGRQVGDTRPGEYPKKYGEGLRFRHDIVTWRKLWDEVGEESGIKFKVEGRTYKEDRLNPQGLPEYSSIVWLEFSVRRID